MKENYLTVRGTFNGKKKLPIEVNLSILDQTKFLNYSAPIVTRVSYLLAGIDQQLKCQECNNLLQIFTGLQNASKFCSLECSRRSMSTKEKRAATNLSRYGVTNPFKDTEKIKLALHNKFGVTNASKLENVRQSISKKNKENSHERIKKINSTCIERYGVDWSGQIEQAKIKKEKTCMDKYGTSTALQNVNVQQKAGLTKLNRYGTTNTSDLPEIKNKIKKTKLDRHGSESYNNRELAKETMDLKYGGDYSRMHWSEETKVIMSNPQLLESVVVNKTINYAADQLGVAPTTLRNVINDFEICSHDYRKNQYEELIKTHLIELGIEFVQGDRTILQGKEIDFLIPSCNLGIECNGIFWHSELMGKTRNYHLDKTKKANSQGIRLMHLWDYQIDQKWPIVSSMISNAVGKTAKKIGARETELCELSVPETVEFFEKNHLQGTARSSIRLGLRYQGQLVSAMTLGQSRFNVNEYELIRFANLINLNVVGSASKLFRAFLDKTHVNKIISYANMDISNGNLYDKLGFSKVSETPPTYMYFYNRTVYNRMQYQKHKLKSLLEIYDDTLSEWENMKRNGYNRFWTTGNIKYEFTKK